MPFYVYQKTGIIDSASEYHNRQSVKLAGRGLIRSTCRRYLSDKDVGWKITDRDMLLQSGYDPSGHALVIDTAPSRPSVSLFEIKSVSGYSYAQWTPIMLTFEQLFVDEETVDPSALKERFSDNDCERRIVRSVLYLSGGYRGGSWNWGGNSRTTAALLWEDAWNYFSKSEVVKNGL